MGSNNFKKSQDVNNADRNIENRPENLENYDEYVSEYRREMRDTKQNATQEGFMARAKNDCPPDAWNDKKKAYNDAWENNMHNSQAEDDF